MPLRDKRPCNRCAGRARTIEWGRAVDGRGFWRLAFESQPLRDSMAWLDIQGLDVP